MSLACKSSRLFPLAACLGALLCAVPLGTGAAEYYVTPTGAGLTNGSNWDNAFGTVTNATALATNAGDAIYLQWGVYSNASPIVISNAASVTIYGGCIGEGLSSNAYSGTNSTLTRAGGDMRIIYAQASTVTMAWVTVSGGYFDTGTNFGAGLYLTNCAVTLTNCVVRDNTNASSSSAYGGGLYAAGGSLTVLDTAFYNNTLRCLIYSSGMGGAIAAVNCPLVVQGSGCVFSNNVGNGVGRANIYGAAIYASGADLTLVGATFVTNQTAPGGDSSDYGGAVYHTGSGGQATISGCRFVANRVWKTSGNSIGLGEGGALHLTCSTAIVTSCTFSNNFCYGSPGAARGGAIYAGGLKSLQVVSNVFHGQTLTGGSKYGGALYLTACTSAVIDHCTLDGSTLTAGLSPELAYVNGGGSTVFLDTTLQNNNAGRGVCFAGAAYSTLRMTNCLFTGNNGNGLTFQLGTGTFVNCLLTRNVQDGVGMVSGTVSAVNCTLAHNGGWGFRGSGGTGTLVNTIAWGNGFGGMFSNAGMSAQNSCLQDAGVGGTSNIYGNPLFANVAGWYYLSVSGLTGQAVSSPCLDAGSNTAAFWGLTNRTTRTDGTNDAGDVDIGYHYAAGVATSVICQVTNCYVDAVNGNDASNGLAWASAWKTLTQALSNVAANATVNLATGTYNAASGELFPLTVQMPGLTLAASNSNPALTVLDNAGTNGQRVFLALGMETVALRGLTFRGGSFTSGENYGGGLSFLGCQVTLTNCIVRDNTNASSSSVYGGGLYAVGGSLSVLDTAFYNNTLRCLIYSSGMGGAIAAVNCPLVVQGSGCVFSNNVGNGVGRANIYGAAIYASGADLTLDNALFITNQTKPGQDSSVYGGALYHTGSGKQATITGCRFLANGAWKTSGNSLGLGEGGALHLSCSTGVITGCIFSNNFAFGSPGAARGGALYASGLQSLQVSTSAFYGHWLTGGSKSGGTLYLSACTRAVLDGCTLDGSGLLVGTAPELVYVNGGGSTVFLDSSLQDNYVGRGLYFGGASNSTLAMTNCLIVDNNGDGLAMLVGNATLFNCLAARNMQDGLDLGASGAVTAVNCTLAHNGGWGFRGSGGTGTVVNGIAWGNSSGGVYSNESMGALYSCLQDAGFGGESNLYSDPLFASVPGCYYLSVSGLTGQASSSPCLDAGSNTAAFWGLTNRTTRTDGTNDAGDVDMGYHYAGGTSNILVTTNCYVDAVNGSNTYDGSSWTSAWQTLTYALSNVAANATINLATGTYSAATGEQFPLTVQMANLTLAASNSNPGLTVLDNAGTNGPGVLQALGMESLELRGLTLLGGSQTNGRGGGLYAVSCSVAMSNCAVRNNQVSSANDSCYGAGICVMGGSLALLNCVVSNNVSNHGSTGNGYGGGVYVSGPALTINDTAFITNRILNVSVSGASKRGGAVYSTGAVVSVSNCAFVGNYNITMRTSGGGSGEGGALYLTGGGATIENCGFTNNYAMGYGSAYGGSIYAGGLTSLALRACTLRRGYAEANAGTELGGALYLAVSNAVVDDCLIQDVGTSGDYVGDTCIAAGSALIQDIRVSSNNGSGIVVVNAGTVCTVVGGKVFSNTQHGFQLTSGTLAMTNCLVVKNAGNGVLVAGGTGALLNCTVADNGGWGLARLTSYGLTVKNSIVWGNTLGGILNPATGEIAYTDSQDGTLAGPGNFSADPLFVSPAAGDYHLQSPAGSWHGGAWEADARLSPCIDAGDPASEWRQEAKPSGGRVNLGAYGNTSEASLSSKGTVIAVW